jgi:hypothetical protein
MIFWLQLSLMYLTVSKHYDVASQNQVGTPKYRIRHPSNHSWCFLVEIK